MRKLNFVLFLTILFPLMSTSIHAQQGKLSLLLPAKPDQDSEVIPITREKLNALTENKISFDDLCSRKPNGIIDTLYFPGDFSHAFRCAIGDTMLAFFRPPAECIIIAIGIYISQINYTGTANGISMSITRSNYHAETPIDSVDGNGWMGYYDASGNWIGSSWGYYPIQWETDHLPLWGDFPIIFENDRLIFTWISTFNFDLDIGREDFLVIMTPFGGNIGDELLFAAADASNLPEWRCMKYYHATGTSGNHGWHIRNYCLRVYAVVEFLEYPITPWITPGGPYGSVLNSDPKALRCYICDFAPTADEAGIDSAKLYYQVNEEDFHFISMYLINGTITDGEWEAVLPAGYMNPGDILTYWFEATNKRGLTATVFGGSFGYFKKNYDLLIFYNDDGTSYPWSVLAGYYTSLYSEYMYDVWVGAVDGPLSAELLNQYDYMVQLDGYSPATMNDDAVGDWFAAGYKHLFWSSQEWGWQLTGGTDSTFAADDWHSMYLGIETIGPMDINTNYTQPFPINAVAGDPISGGLVEFMADSLQLYINSAYELGWNDWCDAMTASDGATICFTDSAQGRTMGVHKENAGSKGIFITFDPLTLDTGPSCYWTECEVFSLVRAAIVWFSTNPVDGNVETGIVSDYSLSQNYPNPFNPETRISYSLAKAGLVKLSVYNLLGQKVADLVNENQIAGEHHETWNATNLCGGIYFYRLDAGRYKKTLKMLLLR